MQSKLEMMFTDNKRSTQCRLTHLESLSPVEIISSRLKLERQLSGFAQSDGRVAGRAWLADVSVDDPAILSLFEFSQAIGPTDNEWDHYHALLERFYEKYEAYLKEKNQYENLRGRTAREVMHPNPKTIRNDALAAEAAQMMEQYRITSVLVVDGDGVLVGAVNSNDLMRAKVI